MTQKKDSGYELRFDIEALKQIEKLPFDIRKRIFKKLQTTKASPHAFFDKLTKRPEYKLRVGKYRVIADIDDAAILILIVHVGHRRNIYS